MSEFDIVLQHGDSLSRTFTFTNVTFVSTDTILFILSPINDDYPLYIEKYTGVTGNSFNLEIDKEETLRIGADEYSYRIVLENDNSRTTILGPARFSVKKGIVKKNNSSASVTLDIITQAEALLEQMSGIAAVGVEEAQALVNSAAASASQVLASASTILTNSANAKTSEDNAKVSETNSKTSETNAKSSEDNAKTYMQQAKNYSENVNVFIPSVTNGILSWTNEANLTNPTPVNIKGDKGDKGDQGIQGIQGVKGDKGDTGERGPQGEKGADGTMTFADLTAEQKASLKGDKGDQGIQGIQGIQGVKGDTGAKGDKGDAFTYEDFTSEQLASLKGAKGDKGDKGEDGTTPDMSLYATKSELAEAGKVKTVNSIEPDENGNIIIKELSPLSLGGLSVLDERYYINEAKVMAKAGGRNYIKANDIPALYCYTTVSGYRTTLLVSDNSNAVESYCSYNTSNHGTIDSLSYKGFTWYYCLTPYGWNFSYYPDGSTDIVTMSSYSTNEDAVKALIDASGANFYGSASYQFYTKDEIDELLDGVGSDYTLPTASATTLGGVKIGSNLSIDENGVLSASGSDEHINELIDAKLGVIENGSY